MRRVLAAANAPAELVQCRQAKAFGTLNEHHGGVGNVDTDLDNAGGHQDVEFASGKFVHNVLLFGSSKAAV